MSDGVGGFKPAMWRVILAAAAYYKESCARGVAECPGCARHVPIGRGLDPAAPRGASPLRDVPAVRVGCPACGFSVEIGLEALALALPEARRFWREHPRMRTLPPRREVEVGGTAAIVTGFESIGGRARLDVVTTRDTFELLAVYSSGPAVGVRR